MKTPSKDLFELINSLTKSEKGYFKKYASMHEGKNSNYIKLFDAIDKMQIYDEKAFKEKYKNEKFIKHLWSTKKYLYTIILKSLNEAKTAKLEYKLNEYYNFIQTLLEKGLYKAGKKYLIKAKSLCLQNELYTSFLKFLIMERKLFNTMHSAKYEADMDRLYNDIHISIEMLNNWNDHQYYSSKLFLLVRNLGTIKSESDFKDIKAIINKPIYRSEKKALTLESKLSFYGVHFFYNYLRKDFEKCYHNSEKLIKYYEASSKIKIRPKTYLQYLNNHLEVCVATRRFDKFKLYLHKYREICKTIGDSNNSLYLTSVSHELTYFIKSGQYEEGIELVKKVSHIINDADTSANIIKAYIYYSSAYLYFLTNNHSESLNYLNKILNNRNLGEDNEILLYARILNLIIHFEMGNLILLEHILKSTFRKLYQKERIYKFEKIIYTFLRKAFRLNNDRALRDSFFELRGKLNEIAKDPFENSSFDFIDIISWLESKMTGKSFAEIVKSKLGENPRSKKTGTGMNLKKRKAEALA